MMRPVPFLIGLPDCTRAVVELMLRYDGACPRHFANHDIYRYSARIHELRELGWKVGKRRCTHHHHQKVIWEYYIEEAPR